MSNYSRTVFQDGPVSYWRLGEASGTTAVDEMGLNNGAYTGTGYSLGVAGALFDEPNRAVSFDGTNGQLAVPHSASLLFTTAMTVECWARMNVAPIEDGEGIINKSFSVSGSWPWTLRLNGYGGAAFMVIFDIRIDDVSTLSARSRAIPIATWVHLVGTYSGSLIRLFVDGVEQGLSVAATGTLGSEALPLLLAHEPAAGTFSNIRLDEVAVYNYALAAEQITTHYFEGVGAGLNQPPPIATDFPAARGRG